MKFEFESPKLQCYFAELAIVTINKYTSDKKDYCVICITSFLLAFVYFEYYRLTIMKETPKALLRQLLYIPTEYFALLLLLSVEPSPNCSHT